jgi:pSer/pThr/pTyr-binding forkhead associated (FHA) protein
MAVQITITERGDLSSSYVRSFLQDRIVLGRARSADICLPDMYVSTRHAEIRLKDNDYAIIDLGSLNGTEVNGKKLVAHRPRPLLNGDEISIAGFRLFFSLGAFRGGAEPRNISALQAGDMLARFIAESGGTPPGPAIEVVSGPGRARRFDLPAAPASLVAGRDPSADIELDDEDISRRHAEVIVEKDGVFIRDLKSRNGILVDGERVEAVLLRPGLHFKLGRTTLTLEHPVERSLAVIMEAPEESTSSFAVTREPGRSEKPGEIDEPEKESNAEIEKMPIGPADPIIDSETNKMLRTTGHIPRPELEDKSDLGLIVIGAIIIAAAVIGLVYLFT